MERYLADAVIIVAIIATFSLPGMLFAPSAGCAADFKRQDRQQGEQRRAPSVQNMDTVSE